MENHPPTSRQQSRSHVDPFLMQCCFCWYRTDVCRADVCCWNRGYRDWARSQYILHLSCLNSTRLPNIVKEQETKLSRSSFSQTHFHKRRSFSTIHPSRSFKWRPSISQHSKCRFPDSALRCMASNSLQARLSTNYPNKAFRFRLTDIDIPSALGHSVGQITRMP